MKIDKIFFKVFAGVLWEWIIIPLAFFIFLPEGENFKFLFPESKIFCLTIGIFYLIPSLFLTFLSCFHLHKKGKGTIMPQNPPEKLVCEGVYFYCRNPMYLGYSFLFASFAFFFKNIFFLFISLGVFLFIFLYAKLYEEKVLFRRFGQDYLKYKKQTPFIIPFSKKILDKSLFSIFFLFSIFLFILQIFYLIRSVLLMVFK